MAALSSKGFEDNQHSGIYLSLLGLESNYLKRITVDYRLVMYLGSMWPVSESARSTTLPFGRIDTHVMEPWFRDIRSQPSGGNWRALQLKTFENVVKEIVVV